MSVRWPHMTEAMIRSIAHAVERQGGDMEDVEDLCDTWERLCGDKRGRVDRLHFDATHAPCTCFDGGVPDDGGARCERCCGLFGNEATR
jgi:hypothetical protein